MWRIYTTFAHRSSSARKSLQRNIIFICVARGARSVRCILYPHQSDGCVRIFGFDDDDAPSPKKALPDFTTRKSDDDSVASGDNSAGWEAEEDRVLNAFAIQTEAEDALEDLFCGWWPDEGNPRVHVDCRQRGGWRGGGNNAEGAAEVDPTKTAVEYETRRVVLQTTNVKTLKAIALMVSMSTNEKKQLIFNRIHNSSAVTKVSEDKFEYREGDDMDYPHPRGCTFC
jgi:hypothetical protein